MRLGVGAIVVIGLATGCDTSSRTAPGSPTPLAKQTSASGPSPSSSTSPELESDAAILAAVADYAAAFTRVGRTASVAPLAGIVDPGCPCEAVFRSLVASLTGSKEHLDAVITVSGAYVLRRSAANADVHVSLANAPYAVLDAAGGVIRRAEGAVRASTISLRREGGRWLVFFVQSA